MMFRHSPPSFGAGSAFWHLASGSRMRQNYISGKSSGLEAVLPGYTRVCGRRSVGRGGAAARTCGGRKEAPVTGALIVARAASAESWEAHSGVSGDFILTLPDVRDYLVSVRRQGYYELQDRPVHVEGPRETTLVLNSVREVFQTIDVGGEPSPIDLAGMQKEERLSETDVNAVPCPASHSLQNATRLMRAPSRTLPARPNSTAPRKTRCFTC